MKSNDELTLWEKIMVFIGRSVDKVTNVSDIEKLKISINKDKDSYDNMIDKICNIKGRISLRKDEIDRLRKEENLTLQIAKKINHKRANLLGQITDITKEDSDLMVELKDIESDLRQSSNNVISIRSKIDNISKEIDVLNNSVIKLQSVADNYKSILDRKISNLDILISKSELSESVSNLKCIVPNQFNQIDISDIEKDINIEYYSSIERLKMIEETTDISEDLETKYGVNEDFDNFMKEINKNE